MKSLNSKKNYQGSVLLKTFQSKESVKSVIEQEFNLK